MAAFKERTAPPSKTRQTTSTPSNHLRTLDMNTMSMSSARAPHPRTSPSSASEWEVEQFAIGNVSVSSSSIASVSASKRSLSPEASPVSHKRLKMYESPVKKSRPREVEEVEDDRMDADDELDLAGPSTLSKIDWTKGSKDVAQDLEMEVMEIEQPVLPALIPVEPEPPVEEIVSDSESESISSEKALKRALNTDVKAFLVDNSDDENEFDDSALMAPSKKLLAPKT